MRVQIISIKNEIRNEKYCNNIQDTPLWQVEIYYKSKVESVNLQKKKGIARRQ